MTQEAKDQAESVRWNDTLIADILHALKAGPFPTAMSLNSPLTPDLMTPNTYNLTHQLWLTPIN